MKRILITGGVGFIGYHLATHLLKQEENQLILADNLQRGKMDKEIKELLKNPRVKFIRADLTDPKFYNKLETNFDHVYHLAAVNGTKFFYEIPHEVLRINTLSLIYMLDWIAKQEKKPKLCFTSSSEAYAGALEAFGKLPLPTPENVPLVISDCYNPRWSYGGSKLIGELLVINYARAYNFPAVIVRPYNFYGPRAGYEHVIPEFCLRVKDKADPFTIYGPEETRTFCFIEDAVDAMQMLMDSKATNSQPIETVNIGNDAEISMKELAEALFDVVGWKPSRFDIKPSPKGSVRRRLSDVNKIKKLIGWTAKTSLSEGLKKTYTWYKDYPKK